MNSPSLALQYFVPTLILIAGFVDDMRSRKVHNWLSMSCLALALLYSFFMGGWNGVGSGLLAGVAAILMTLPLAVTGILGAGDLKLFVAFGVSITWPGVVATAIGALIWASIFGLLKALVNGEALILLRNTLHVAIARKPLPKEKLHPIPYTFAILMSWASYLWLTQTTSLSLPWGTP